MLFLLWLCRLNCLNCQQIRNKAVTSSDSNETQQTSFHRPAKVYQCVNKIRMKNGNYLVRRRDSSVVDMKRIKPEALSESRKKVSSVLAQSTQRLLAQRDQNESNYITFHLNPARAL